MTPPQNHIRIGFFLIVSLLGLHGLQADDSAAPTAPAAPTVVWRWDAANWLSKYNQAQFSATPITNPDGTQGAAVTVTPRDAGNPYNHIVVSNANMTGGNMYTAILTFSVTEPTVYPTSFFIFARNSAGNQYDIFQTFIGLPGSTRTLAVPLNLRAIEGGKWQLYMGISKSGGITINSLIVYSGITSDGKTLLATQPPATGGTAASDVPKGVSAATGFTPFTLDPPASKGPTLSTADYGLVADKDGAPESVAIANAAALQKAFADCVTKGASKLIVPTGVYRLEPTVGIHMDNLKDVTIDGQGSTFIFEKLTKDGTSFAVGKCERTVIENMNMDWDWNNKPIASLATISNVSADKLQCDFTFPDLTAAQTDATRAAQWRSAFSMDPKRLLINDTNHIQLPKTTVLAAGSAPNVIHATFPTPVPFTEGGTYCIRHLYYDMGGYKVADCTNLLFKSDTIYSIPGMGWFFEGVMHNFELIDCHIVRAPGSRHPLTTAADGFHIDQSIGNAIFDNCSITGTGDDAMNLHNEVYQGQIVTDPADPKKITLVNCPPYQLRILPGDSVDFFNADFSNLQDGAAPVSRAVASTTSSFVKGKPQTVLTFTDALPDGVTPASIIRNAKYATKNVLVSNCHIFDTAGRGILLSADDATITNCHIDGIYAVPIDLESEIVQPLWTEGRGASNIVIKGNTFENDNGMGRYGGAYIYSNTRIPWGPTQATLYNRITIEENHFVNCPGPAVSLTNASSLIVRSNEIRLTQPVANATHYAGTIFITTSSNVALGGNKWINEITSASDYGVVYDPATTSNITFGTNVVADNVAKDQPKP